MKPAKDINMATQSEIGSFSDEKQVYRIKILLPTFSSMYLNVK